jgi:hypothetical protein
MEPDAVRRIICRIVAEESISMSKKPKLPSPVAEPCEVCAGAMKHVRTIPAAGIMRELHTFICSVCGCPRTEEGAAPDATGRTTRYAA